MKRQLQINRILVILTIISAALMLASCSAKSKSAKDADALGLSEADLNAQREGRYAGGAIPTAEGEGPFRDVRFAFDSSTVDDLARQDIEHNLQVLQDHPEIGIQLEGHADERGTAEYNLALGSRRARAVYDLLVSYGVPASRLETISYGEEVPLDPASSESAWAKNRRVHFTAFGGQKN